MIWKLLRQHISISQLVGFFLANLCGMVIVLLSIQFYKDVVPAFTDEDGFMKADYLILSKKVSTVGSFMGNSVTFDTDEIEELSQQPFSQKVGAFQPAQFQVSAGLGMAGVNLSTAMFFESVPDAFVDVKAKGWDYHEGDEEIPIIIPRDYLNLYNFGFAQSRNLPKLSEGVMSMMTMNIQINGNGQSVLYKGRIVGFSNRLNTILVPESFMDFANKKYGEGKTQQPSRLIIEVKNPTDDRIAQYIKQKGYDTEEDKLDAGKATWFLKVVVGIVLSVGLLISILSFYLLMLSIYLLLQKNTTKLRNLRLIGFSRMRVALPYQLLTIMLNAFVLAVACLFVSLARTYYIGMLERLFPDLGGSGMWLTYLSGFILFVGVSVLNILAIRQKINRIL